MLCSGCGGRFDSTARSCVSMAGGGLCVIEGAWRRTWRKLRGSCLGGAAGEAQLSASNGRVLLWAFRGVRAPRQRREAAASAGGARWEQVGSGRALMAYRIEDRRKGRTRIVPTRTISGAVRRGLEDWTRSVLIDA